MNTARSTEYLSGLVQIPRDYPGSFDGYLMGCWL